VKTAVPMPQRMLEKVDHRPDRSAEQPITSPTPIDPRTFRETLSRSGRGLVMLYCILPGHPHDIPLRPSRAALRSARFWYVDCMCPAFYGAEDDGPEDDPHATSPYGDPVSRDDRKEAFKQWSLEHRVLSAFVYAAGVGGGPIVFGWGVWDVLVLIGIVLAIVTFVAWLVAGPQLVAWTDSWNPRMRSLVWTAVIALFAAAGGVIGIMLVRRS
jgi:hypothetical protein